MANSNVFPVSSYIVLESRLANEQASCDTPCQSWESVLKILGEENTVDQDGDLKLVPTFLSLPLVIQLRFIIFLQSNILQVTCHAINTFLQCIETSQTNISMKEAICQLRNTIAQRSIETRNFSRLKDAKYTFTSQSQNAFEAITSRLINRKRMPWEICPASSNLDRGKDEAAVSVTNIATPKNTDGSDFKAHSDVSAMNLGPMSTTHTLPCDDDKAMDIIIIDDESTDSVITIMDNSPIMNVNNMINISKESFNMSDKNNSDVRKSDNIFSSALSKLDNRKDKELASESIHLGNQHLTSCNSLVSDKPNQTSCEQSPADPSIPSCAMKNEKKRKLAEIVNQNEELEHSALKKCALVNSRLYVDTVNSAVEITETLQPSSDEIKLPRNMVYLDGIREACLHKENAGVVSKEIMDCFLDMDTAEISVACTYLGLTQFSEKALVNFCDNVPWSSLGSDASSMLLYSCFSSKLRHMESPASRILLMSLDSVSKIQPKVVINVLADSLAVSKSGEFQCQVLTSVCKEFLPLDCFEYLIRQLSNEAIVVNEHAVSVLQTLVDRCPNLATDSVNYFHSVLTATSHELSTSAKFGKLLMGVLTKYGEKMSSEQFTAVCAIVETHNSSFRKPLLTLVKRLTRVS
ncbi:hypothetical protein BsWGS_08200 [Bradybaena similaris]